MLPTNPRILYARVSVPSGGGLAQLGEHYVRNVGVGGSTPLPSTNFLIIGKFPSLPFLAVPRVSVAHLGLPTATATREAGASPGWAPCL